jgi:hypothetical protein
LTLVVVACSGEALMVEVEVDVHHWLVDRVTSTGGCPGLAELMI